jgi:preprotein translocase subunit SecE
VPNLQLGHQAACKFINKVGVILNSKVENSKSGVSAVDIAKYALALVLLLVGLVAWWWSAGQWAAPLRALAVIVGIALGAVVFLTTAKGHQTREFLGESRFELRKVVWPTRQEAWRMTWVVIIAVVVMSLLLGGIDVVIQFLVGKFLSFGRGS